jgi:hypothetical protein
MSKSIRAAVVTAVFMLALTGGTSAYGNESTAASASGASHFTLHDVFGLQTLVLQSFTFRAALLADGSVAGQYSYRDIEDGVPFDASGPVTCFVVHGNHAWVGGTIEASNDPAYVGQESWFQVIDNGEGAQAPPDITTLLGTSPVPDSAQAYCDAAPNPRFPWPVADGNIQVRPQ